MTPVKQSKLYCTDGIHNGNCYTACLASLLDLPLWMVPPFEDMFGRGDWRSRTDDWLKRFFNLQLVRVEGHEPSSLPEYYIANGPAKRGVNHSVIYQNGELAHDPHPSCSGLLEVEWCWYLEKISAQ
jgi:hypothetical protein